MRPPLTPAWRASAIMGMCCMPVGLAMGIYVMRGSLGSDYGAFVFAAPVAAFLSGTLCWWAVVARRADARRWRAVMAGALAAGLGHWLCWYLLFVHAYVWNAITGAPPAVSGPIVNPLMAVAGSGLYALLSLYFFGWITVPVGALIGWGLAQLNSRQPGTSAGTPAPPERQCAGYLQPSALIKTSSLVFTNFISPLGCCPRPTLPYLGGCSSHSWTS